jgi:GrpB-like predicted nucleotidyltransferase (UPF0157 family)
MEYFVHRKSWRLEIIPYQERWVEEFNILGARLRKIIGDAALRIDHIGSTSVPGLGANDVIDIQITVTDIHDIEELNRKMKEHGFQTNGELHRDHEPPGFSGELREWVKRYFREPEGEKRMHIHVREAGRLNQRYPILFRDYLRENARARQLYETLKKRLVQLVPECVDAYLYIKSPVVDLVMLSAERWAEETDWEMGPSDA